MRIHSEQSTTIVSKLSKYNRKQIDLILKTIIRQKKMCCAIIHHTIDIIFETSYLKHRNQVKTDLPPRSFPKLPPTECHSRRISTLWKISNKRCNLSWRSIKRSKQRTSGRKGATSRSSDLHRASNFTLCTGSAKLSRSRAARGFSLFFFSLPSRTRIIFAGNGERRTCAAQKSKHGGGGTLYQTFNWVLCRPTGMRTPL